MTVSAPATTPTPTGTVAEQAAVLLGNAAGYVGHRTIAIGLRSGLLGALADAGQPGLDPDALADRLALDPFYVAAWCRAAFAAGVCDRDDARYRLTPHTATLLLDTDSPGYVGGVFGVLEQPEFFDRFEASLASGERLWWDGCSPEFIHAVSGTGRPFYARLVPAGLDRVPGLAERLAAGCLVVDTACGAGVGLLRLATHYPRCTLIGVDGDAHSLALAESRLAEAGVADRVRLVHSPLEGLDLPERATLIVNNISMHECRDADRVTSNVHRTLEDGGWFVVSDFPFPDDDAGLRTVPGRVMTGIQVFEAQIDDQLVPRRYYDELLGRHGFRDIGSFGLTPMHAVTYGRR